jgi:hypothetical protein
MKTRLAVLLSLLVAASLVAGCATSGDSRDRELRDEGPPQCVRQDLMAFNSTIRTCVQSFGPSTLPEEMQPRNPHVVTVVDTPRGQFSYPLTWSMEVRRDGELVVEREFAEGDTAVEEGDDRLEIRSALPLAEDEELVPGIYEFRYRTSEGEDVGTTTIEVQPLDEAAPEDPPDQ